jgi:hypothetical protein
LIEHYSDLEQDPFVGSVPKCHGSGTLLDPIDIRNCVFYIFFHDWIFGLNGHNSIFFAALFRREFLLLHLKGKMLIKKNARMDKKEK